MMGLDSKRLAVKSLRADCGASAAPPASASYVTSACSTPNTVNCCCCCRCCVGGITGIEFGDDRIRRNCRPVGLGRLSDNIKRLIGFR